MPVSSKTGIWPDAWIWELVCNGHLVNAHRRHVGTSYLNLHFSDEAYCAGKIRPARGLRKENPRETVGDYIRRQGYPRASLSDPFLRDEHYFIRLQESCHTLPQGLFGKAAPRLHTSQLNIEAELAADGMPVYGILPPSGYGGSLWALVCCRSFPIRFMEGASLLKLQLYNAIRTLSEDDLSVVLGGHKLLWYPRDNNFLPLDNHLSFSFGDGSITLRPALSAQEAGFKFKRTRKVLNYQEYGIYQIGDFFDILRPDRGIARLKHAGDSCLVYSHESLHLPLDHRYPSAPLFCAELMPLNAGSDAVLPASSTLIPPGHGCGQPHGAPCILQLRAPSPRDIHRRDGIARLVFHYMAEHPLADQATPIGDTRDILDLLSDHFKK